MINKKVIYLTKIIGADMVIQLIKADLWIFYLKVMKAIK